MTGKGNRDMALIAARALHQDITTTFADSSEIFFFLSLRDLQKALSETLATLQRITWPYLDTDNSESVRQATSERGSSKETIAKATKGYSKKVRLSRHKLRRPKWERPIHFERGGRWW